MNNTKMKIKHPTDVEVLFLYTKSKRRDEPWERQ